MVCESCGQRIRDENARLREGVRRLEQIIDALTDANDEQARLLESALVHLASFEPDYYRILFDDDERDLFDSVAPFGREDDGEEDGSDDGDLRD